MSKIPTAKEVLEQVTSEYENRFKSSMDLPEIKDLILNTAMIRHTQLYVQAALKAAADNSLKMSSSYDTILNAYPLDNIK